jgi:hypothetical protein
MGVVREHTAGPDPGSGEHVAHRIPAPHDDGGELAVHLSPTSADAEDGPGLAAKKAMATSSSMTSRRRVPAMALALLGCGRTETEVAGCARALVVGTYDS